VLEHAEFSYPTPDLAIRLRLGLNAAHSAARAHIFASIRRQYPPAYYSFSWAIANKTVKWICLARTIADPALRPPAMIAAAASGRPLPCYHSQTPCSPPSVGDISNIYGIWPLIVSILGFDPPQFFQTTHCHALPNRMVSEHPFPQPKQPLTAMPFSLTCRQRKLKCDEKKPTCSQCCKASRECIPSSGIVFRHQHNASMNGDEWADENTLKGFYAYKNTFDDETVWLDIPKHGELYVPYVSYKPSNHASRSHLYQHHESIPGPAHTRV
jgi:hypothetical protein